MQQIFENKYFIFFVESLFLLFFLTRYLKPRLDGVIKKRTRLPGITSLDWRKEYGLNGTWAFTIGLIALIILTGLIYGWIGSAIQVFSSGFIQGQ